MFFLSGKNEIEGLSSFINKISLKGLDPKLLTPLNASFWYGASPDGNYIVYCTDRNRNYDIYKMNLDGREEIRLTTAEILDDGPENSPDGK